LTARAQVFAAVGLAFLTFVFDEIHGPGIILPSLKGPKLTGSVTYMSLADPMRQTSWYIFAEFHRQSITELNMEVILLTRWSRVERDRI